METESLIDDKPLELSPEEAGSRTLEDKVRSVELNDIMDKTPGWFVQWGITAIFVGFAAVLGICFIIRYPDIIYGRITITSNNPPAMMVAQADGALRLMTKDNEAVKKDQYLAIIRNTSNDQDMMYVRDHLEQWRNIADNPQGLVQEGTRKGAGKTGDFNLYLNLGDIQHYYLSFVSQYEQYKLFFQLRQHEQQIASYNSQIGQHAELQKVLSLKERILNEEIQLLDEQFRLDSSLYANKAISKVDFERTKLSYLSSRKNLMENKREFLDNGLRAQSIRLQEVNMQLDKIKQDNEYRRNIMEAYKNLESKFRDWEKMYVLKSPMDGRVSLFKYWDNNQFINRNEEALAVISASEKVYGKLLVPAQRFGKVKTGQRVRIDLDSYKADEYGAIFGKVTSISEINVENSYMVEVELPDGLVSSYKKAKLEYKPHMQGNGQIVTEDLTIASRIFYRLRDIFKD